MNRWCSICRYLPALEDLEICESCLEYEIERMRSDDAGDDQPPLRVGPFRYVERVDAREEFV